MVINRHNHMLHNIKKIAMYKEDISSKKTFTDWQNFFCIKLRAYKCILTYNYI